MTTELAIRDKSAIDLPGRLWEAGQVANDMAARHVFDDYRNRKAKNTIARQDNGLTLFAKYLGEAGVITGNLTNDPEAWRGVTWGLVTGFVQWQLKQGYSIGSVNIRLSTVKTYCKLALKAKTLDATEYALVRAVSGYRREEGKHIDERREAAGISTRFVGEQTGRPGRPLAQKKAIPTSITKDQADALKARPDDPQGRRDAVIMHLLLDLGLRVGELASLTIGNFDLQDGTLTFYREKVHKTQTHKLINGSLAAVRAYLEKDALAIGLLLRASQRGGRLRHAGMSKRAITARVKALGERLGIEGLSAHDLRHYWATRAARRRTPLDRLQNAGGWASSAMPLRYIKDAEIANEGVVLD